MTVATFAALPPIAVATRSVGILSPGVKLILSFSGVSIVGLRKMSMTVEPTARRCILSLYMKLKIFSSFCLFVVYF